MLSNRRVRGTSRGKSYTTNFADVDWLLIQGCSSAADADLWMLIHKLTRTENFRIRTPPLSVAGLVIFTKVAKIGGFFKFRALPLQDQTMHANESCRFCSSCALVLETAESFGIRDTAAIRGRGRNTVKRSISITTSGLTEPEVVLR